MDGLIDHTESPDIRPHLRRKVAPIDGDQGTAALNARPTEAEYWKAFWEQVAIMWLELPPEIQREYAEKYPKGSSRRPTPVFPSVS